MVNPHLPQPTAFHCQQIKIEPDVVTIVVESSLPDGHCPLCGHPSSRMHSHYTRRVRDLPWQGRSVRLRLIARKFFCLSPACPRKIFAARLPEIVVAHARNTVRLNDTLSSIAFSCGGEAGSRLARRLGMPVSADTLLRTIRRTHIPVPSTLRIVGVDDWAMRKGLRYGTLLCGLEQHRPIDLLNDREPDTIAAWLSQHPEIEVITRDRAHCYAEGASRGAPQAIQVADRFHLVQNLRQALVKMLDHRYPQMVLAMKDTAGRSPPLSPNAKPVEEESLNRGLGNRLPLRPAQCDVRCNRRLERFDKVMELHRQGMSHREIARRLSIHRETVARYTQARVYPERATRNYASKTDQFTDYLKKRWQDGCQKRPSTCA